MQNINFHIDPTTRSNHKRSFDFQRRNHITQKKFDNKVVPTRWVAPQFETFDAYMSDLQSKMAALFNERKGLFLPDEERGFDIHIETTPHNYGILALYNGIDRRTGNVKFTYRLDDLVCAFYYPEEQGRKEEEEQVKSTTDHEIRHHIDRKFINYTSSKNIVWDAVMYRPLKYLEENSDNLLRKYLGLLRTEGFAEFSEKLGAPFSERALQKEIQIAKEGVTKLGENPTIDRLEWYHYTDKNGFNAYRQGKALFQVIALAERMRLDNLNPAPLDLILSRNPQYRGPLFSTPEMFTRYLGVLHKITSMPKYDDFANYYNECADQLMLNVDTRGLVELIERRIDFHKRGSSVKK